MQASSKKNQSVCREECLLNQKLFLVEKINFDFFSSENIKLVSEVMQNILSNESDITLIFL